MIISNWHKIIAISLYLLPWSDAIPFGSSLFIQFPVLQYIVVPALPLLILERLIPFGGLIIFFALFIGVVRNNNIPYFIRFNALQAVLVDICILLLSYALQILIRPLGSDLFFRTISSTCLVAALSVIIFSISECMQGKEPDLPGISDAVRMQL